MHLHDIIHGHLARIETGGLALDLVRRSCSSVMMVSLSPLLLPPMAEEMCAIKSHEAAVSSVLTQNQLPSLRYKLSHKTCGLLPKNQLRLVMYIAVRKLANGSDT